MLTPAGTLIVPQATDRALCAVEPGKCAVPAVT